MFAFFYLRPVALCCCWHRVFTAPRSRICRWRRISLCLGAGPGSRKALPWGRTCAGLSGSAGLCHDVLGLGLHHPPRACFFPSSLSKRLIWLFCKPMSNVFIFSPMKTELPKKKKEQYFNKFESESFLFFFFFLFETSLKSPLKNSAFQSKVGFFFPGISFNFPYTTEHLSPASPLKIVCKENK